ncbi:hypothetical protein [Flavobacterium limnophilum]|uniref:hypothetical protein n=1 Tax=Flavobacterium limnophilum TaxID=3003262 RepID=UPI0022AC2411|nr:hypothetical protein [Flavobacterium limnophilum]
MKKPILKKIILSILFLTIISCSSTKTTSKDNKKITQISTYSGIKATEDTYFKRPSSIVQSGDKIFVADTDNNLIRQIQDNKITTFVGNGKHDNYDGKLLEASLSNPNGLIIDSKNNIYTIADNIQIKKIDPEGNVTIFAGEKHSPGFYGAFDGKIEFATFKFITSLAIDDNDNIFVVEQNRIRKISKGFVTTIAGSTESGDKIGTSKEALFHQISDIAISKNGEIFISDQANGKVKKMSSDGIVSEFIPRGNIYWPTSIKFNSKGELIVFDSNKKKFYVADKNGKIINTFSDKKILSENYYFKVKMIIDKNDDIIIPSLNFINIIDKNLNIVQIGEENGFCRNGDINKATYDIPYDGIFDKTGNLFIIEKGNNLVRKISKEGIVSIFSGSGNYGDKDGESTNCKFSYPQSITIDNLGNLYILDGYNNDSKIKKIDSTGKAVTFIDPIKRKLNWKRPCDMVCDSENNIFLSDSEKNTILKIDPIGNVLEYITPRDINLKMPEGLAIDKKNNLYVCDSYNHRIVKIDSNKKIEIIIPSNNIALDEPEHITIDDFGNLYVTDKNRTRIIKISNEKYSDIYIDESTLGTNKQVEFSEYYNTLNIEAFENNIFVFDKYNHQIIKLNQRDNR